MKHVSWIVALLVGVAIGAVGMGALGGAPQGPRPTPAQAQRPRPVEDPRAVYRVPVDDSPAKGPADALVTIVESSDFECPFCKRGAATMADLAQQYQGKVRFVFKHNPLPFHARALPSAGAAEAARAEGGDAKFWALHDKLFEVAPALDQANLEKAFQELGLDAGKLKDALAAGKYKDRIERDQRLVQSVGAPATPTFFINGRKIAGAQPAEAFKAVIDDELKKAEALVQAGTPAAGVYAKIMERAATAPVYQAGTAPAPGQDRPAAPAAPPPSQYQKVSIRPDDPVRGAKDAKLTVVLFSDFQCPYCGRVEPTLKQLLEAYPNDVRIVWKHQPLPMHPNAVPAALAAEAAREQGKFWEMHDKLFADQRALAPDTYERYAKELGLDLKRFKASIEAKKGQDRITADSQLGSSVGASGTPTLFFNCRQFVGARPWEQMKAVADEELAKANGLLKGGKPGPDFYEKACQANLAAAPAAGAAAAPAKLAPGQLALRADDPVRGNPKAPVTLVLFSDFQCPFCSRVEPTLQQAMQEYGDKLRIVWKHQPLPFHPNAMPAAEAAEAAREQGKFWQMHDKLFADQRALSDAAYDQYARELGLDLKRFAEARASGRARARIAEDQALASRIGATGTPTMFVNGEKVEGAVPYPMLKAAIDRQLQAAAAR